MIKEETLHEKDQYDYDFVNDSFYAFPKNRSYKSSFIMDDIILDVNEKNEFAGIEILDASKKFGISKSDLRSPVKLKVHLQIKKDVIIIGLEITVSKRNQKVSKTISESGLNDMNLPPGSATLALA
ncbi:protein of unknown function DUF2283 [Methanosalsum zhilinae DSM 4017]|uniref:DUF2283 domain-containing protein n=1 Tax=Methanosalsum zhilinae (strain DSM 4017 / NBRC 107636 / OCM 62 / WeN5) TaxID=679901 RepID=F7XNC0_METZD|nr:DUF2283 domain-containing protein [Methanosalsum zhilinae]AEH60081.1 protein of unknown function DUF2283 [Methanosalsum zhilinae DSM 4017]